MKKFRTIVSLIAMVLAGVVGFLSAQRWKMPSAVQFSFH